MRNDDTTSPTTTEEEVKQVASTSKPKRAKKAKATKKAKTKVKAKVRAKAKRGNGRLALDEDRKDKFAAALRIRAGTPRAKIVEHLANKNGKSMTSADALAKLSGFERRTVMHFVTVRIPAKAKNYGLKYEVSSDGEGNYGLKVR